MKCNKKQKYISPCTILAYPIHEVDILDIYYESIASLLSKKPCNHRFTWNKATTSYGDVPVTNITEFVCVKCGSLARY